MLGEDDLSSRFDYLFEPLDDESAGDTVDAGSPVSDPSDDKKSAGGAAPVRIAFAAFVIAALGAVAAIAMLLLQRPDGPAEPVDTPLVPSPLSTTAPNVTPQVDPAPPAMTTASAVPTGAPQTIDSGPQQLPASQAPATT